MDWELGIGPNPHPKLPQILYIFKIYLILKSIKKYNIKINK